MKYLALGLLLCSLASLSNASCYRKLPQAGMTQCQDDTDKTWHEMGSSWRNSQCMDCTCDECCSAYSTPTHYPEDCEAVFDSKACEYIVHKKGNPSELCPIHGAVGK